MTAAGRLALGVDLGGSNLRLALVGEDGRVMASDVSGLTRRPTPEQAAAEVAGALSSLVAAAGRPPDESLPVGVGLAAQLGSRPGQVLVAPNLGWRNVDFGGLLERQLGRPVALLNDVDAIALAESSFGAAAGRDAVLAVFVGTGVGGGLVLGGSLYQGSSGVAGEIGHVKVRPGGRRCGCGQRGCLEAYLGGANLSAWLEEMVGQGWPALENLARQEGTMHPGLVEHLAARGDARATALWRELAGMLGLALANAVTLLNPAALVLGGTVLKNCPMLLELTMQTLAEQTLAVAFSGLEVCEDSLGKLAGCIGAALYARQPN